MTTLHHDLAVDRRCSTLQAYDSSSVRLLTLLLARVGPAPLDSVLLGLVLPQGSKNSVHPRDYRRIVLGNMRRATHSIVTGYRRTRHDLVQRDNPAQRLAPADHSQFRLLFEAGANQSTFYEVIVPLA